MRVSGISPGNRRVFEPGWLEKNGLSGILAAGGVAFDPAVPGLAPGASMHPREDGNGTRHTSLSGLQAAAAAREAFPQKVHALLDGHREPAADELLELAVAFLAHRVEHLPTGL